MAALSADARFTASGSAAASGYAPQNGPTLSPFFGIHVSDFISFQASYTWNRNDVRYHTLTGAEFFDQDARTTHQLWLGDAMLYFRNRRSWVRPYLAAGTGVARIKSEASPAAGTLAGAPGSFVETSAVLNVAVGIDLAAGRAWWFRYCFGETIQPNPFSNRLTPPGQRNLAGFRNFFGFVKYF